jgi:multidrug efflux pump
MLFATVIGVLLIPLFFVTVRRVLGDKLDEQSSQFIEQHKVRSVQQDR